jgi:hypothetical protein
MLLLIIAIFNKKKYVKSIKQTKKNEDFRDILKLQLQQY